MGGLVVEIDGEGGVFAAVPGGFGDGEVEDDEAVRGFAWGDLGLAKQRRVGLAAGEGFEGREAEIEVGEVGLFDGAGGDGFGGGGVGGGEGGVEVFEEERQAEPVVDVDVDEDVEVVLGGFATDDGGVGFEDGVGREGGGAFDREGGGGVRGEAEDEEEDGGEGDEGEGDGDEEVAAFGLGKGDVFHSLIVGGPRCARRDGGDCADLNTRNALKRTRQVVKQSKRLPWNAAAVETLQNSFHIGARDVEVLVCLELSVPVTVTWWRAMVLLPPAYEAMSEVEQMSLMAHELAHVSRRDFEVNLLLEFVSLAICFHPATAWLKKRIAVSREAVCDEMAAEATVGRTQYARFLLDIAQQTEEPSRVGLALGMSNTALERRILTLLDPVNKSRRYAVTVSLLSTAALLGMSVAALCFSLHPTSVQAAGAPAFAFDPSQTFDRLTPNAERKQAPDFSLIDNNGKTITLSAYKGKVVLLNFWPTWCSLTCPLFLNHL